MGEKMQKIKTQLTRFSPLLGAILLVLACLAITIGAWEIETIKHVITWAMTIGTFIIFFILCIPIR